MVDSRSSGCHHIYIPKGAKVKYDKGVLGQYYLCVEYLQHSKTLNKADHEAVLLNKGRVNYVTIQIFESADVS